VSWQLPNWIEAVVVHHAALRIGAISNPIVSIYRHSEIKFILRQAASKIMLVPESFRGFDYPGMLAAIRDGLPDLRTVVVIGGSGTGRDVGYDELIGLGRDRPLEPTQRSANDLALLLYTSGTTSQPKGVLHTHNTLDYENRSVIDFFRLSETDVVFMPSPVGHITGVLSGMQLPFALGSAVVLLDIWDPGRALALIAAHRCGFTVAATPFLHGLLNHPDLADTDTSALRVFICGGAEMPPDLIRSAESALQCTVTRAYGSTEHPMATSGNQLDTLDARSDTDGRAILAARVRIVDDCGSAVPAAVTGEVLVRGPALFVGYLDPKLNDDSFTPDGWFHTGDLGRLDADGYLEITGRHKDIIIRGGENISAKEIEDHLFGHPKIAEIAVIASPDPVLVERVCAVVVAEAGQTITLAEIIDWLAARQFAKQKLPERLIVLDELPRTASGKVQKFKLRDLVGHLDSG
jgi:cyclohexanecarboxylate-CoA ligase